MVVAWLVCATCSQRGFAKFSLLGLKLVSLVSQSCPRVASKLWEDSCSNVDEEAVIRTWLGKGTDWCFLCVLLTSYFVLWRNIVSLFIYFSFCLFYFASPVFLYMAIPPTLCKGWSGALYCLGGEKYWGKRVPKSSPPLHRDSHKYIEHMFELDLCLSEMKPTEEIWAQRHVYHYVKILLRY